MNIAWSLDSDEVLGTHRLPSAWIIYIVLAAVAANRMGSPPVWLLLVGPPSSGKTEVVDVLSLLPEYLAVSTFTEAGLLSGSSVREGGSATGGLLMQLKDPGLLVASDFGTLLNEHGSTRNRLFAIMREIFDGLFIRRLGINGGQEFVWSGHAGFIGACTEAVDSPAIDLGVLGERFTYFRLPEATPSDEFMACVLADENVGHLGEIRSGRASQVAEFFENLVVPDEFPPISESEQERLVTLAAIGSKCRSSVVREGHSREIELVPGAERSPRFYRQLRHLHGGLTVIGAPKGEIWGLLAKVALDGMHPGRWRVIDYLMAHPGGHATAVVAGHLLLPQTPVRRHLQDLCAHGLVELIGDHPERWTPSPWLRESWWAVRDSTPWDRS